MSSFPRDASILYFGPCAPVRPRTRRHLLWPAWTYRVVAPEVRERQINVLQKAVLGLCRAGVGAAERIGQKLLLHTDLAAQICLELQDKRLLDSRSMPTQEGLLVLEDETLSSHRFVTGHVFQDPWKGDLWPRFIQRLDRAEVEMGKSGFPDLILGTKGSPRRERAFMHLPRGIEAPIQPAPKEILRASARHRSALRSSGHTDEREQEDRTYVDAGVPLDRLSLVDERPTPIFLATFLYLPDLNEGSGTDWDVCDPFGLGASARLRQSIERSFPTSPRLRSLVEDLLGTSIEQQVDAQRRWVEEIRQKAEIRIDGWLYVGARSLRFHGELVEMESARIDAESLGDHCSQHKRQSLLVAGRRVLEAAFRSIAARHPNHRVWSCVYAGGKPNEDQEFVASVYEAAAKAIGLVTPLPRSLRGVKPAFVQAASFGATWRLRAAIVVALLVARGDASHPLCHAARRDPKVLILLDEIAEEAGEAAHGGYSPRSLQQVLTAVEKVQQVIKLLFDVVPPPRTQPITRST